MNAISTSLSGMKAAQTMMDVTANNIANLNTKNFQQKEVVLQEQKQGGVSVTQIKNSLNPVQQSSDMSNNVNLNQQMVTLMQSQIFYSVNAKALKIESETIGKVVNVYA
jgi:flagellar basal body rod protein FlgG